MELMVIITTLCIISHSVMVTPCASQQIQVQSSDDQAQDLPVSVLSLPRKLRFIEEASTEKANAGKESSSYNRLEEGSLSGKHHHKEARMVHGGGGGGGRWQEWLEEERTDPSQLFTMDYSHVRRQRPIHNKFVPVGP